MEAHARPIGVFDSGVGGLSVLRQLRAELPAEHMLYVADSGHCPYGGKPYSEIRARADAIASFLVGQGAKLIVVACNTATVAAVEHLRATLEVPIVGMEPAVKPAAAATQSGVVGVLATGATLAGERFAQLAQRYADGVELLTQPCPGLVEQVEAGDLDGPETGALLRRYVEPLLARGADTLVLGCTHYPFLRPALTRLVGPDVALIDTGAAVARQTRRVLETRGLLEHPSQPGANRFLTSGLLESVEPVISRLWGARVELAALPA